jgi:hypothetical protein
MADKEQIGLTAAGAAVMDRVLATGYFAGKDDVAKLAIALAVQSEVPAEGVRGAETTWHTKGLDSDGDLRTAVSLAYPKVTEPYRVIEGLIDIGLQLIGEHIERRGELVLPELLGSNVISQDDRRRALGSASP